ncbi:MAG TPA: hypothetical protein VGP63_16190 [Planctomycetaceae bacterium]|nr:hypothetical protein [Planctomycetaceae bacterium]
MATASQRTRWSPRRMCKSSWSSSNRRWDGSIDSTILCGTKRIGRQPDQTIGGKAPSTTVSRGVRRKPILWAISNISSRSQVGAGVWERRTALEKRRTRTAVMAMYRIVPAIQTPADTSKSCMDLANNDCGFGGVGDSVVGPTRPGGAVNDAGGWCEAPIKSPSGTAAGRDAGAESACLAGLTFAAPSFTTSDNVGD